MDITDLYLVLVLLSPPVRQLLLLSVLVPHQSDVVLVLADVSVMLLLEFGDGLCCLPLLH